MESNPKPSDIKINEETESKIEKSLMHSVNDARFWAIMSGFGESYLSAFAVFLNATSFQMGLFGSIPQFISAMLQIFAVKLTNIFQSRKQIVLFFATLQGLSWIAIFGVSYYFRNVWVLIILATLYFTFGSLPGPAWSSWMGDLVPEKRRGTYFGYRNKSTSIVSFISVLIAGTMLNYFSTFDPFLGFTILFTIAAIGRIISVTFQLFQFEPNVELREPQGESIITFIKNIKKNNFGFFTTYVSLFMMVVTVSGPLMVLYWLKYLQFSYVQYTIIISTATIANFLTMTTWGKATDRYGNKTILEVSSSVLVALPFLWTILLFVPQTSAFYFALAIQVASGLAWAGFNLSSGNLIYDTVEPIKRVRLISYHNIIKGSAIFIGGLFGGLLATIPFNPNSSYALIAGPPLALVTSTILRFIIVKIYLKKIEETRIVEKAPHPIHLITTLPVQGVMYDTIFGMNRTLKKFRERLTKVESKLDIWEDKFGKV